MQIVSPAEGSTVNGVYRVKVSAPGIRKVNFYVDGVLKHRDVSEPFTFDWYTARYTDGPHVLKAVASSGKQSTPDVKIFVANGVPAIVTDSMSEGQTVKGVVPWSVTCKGNCVWVQFWATLPGKTPVKLADVAGDISKPFGYTWDTTKFPNSDVLLGLVAVDSLGARYPSNNRKKVIVANPVPEPVYKTTVTLSGSAVVDDQLVGTISCQ